VAKRFLLGLLLALTPISAAAAPSLDGYSFETEQFEHRTVTVTFVPLEKQTDLRALSEIAGLHPRQGQVKGFTINGAGSCTIYMMDPKVAYEPEFLGHELAHCIYGNFHPQKDKEIK
jgi:hypothetical protein